MPSPNRITIHTLSPALQNLSLFIVALIADMGIILSTIYIESAGAKLLLLNLKWPKEIIAILAFIGIPARYFSPSTVFGIASTFVLFAGTYLIVRYAHEMISTVQKNLPSIIHGNRENLDLTEVYSLFRPLVVSIVVGVFIYGVLFDSWMQPAAQLMMAKTLWPTDFQPIFQGDSIRAVKVAVPDLNTILQNHEGEFYKNIVISFPSVILVFHITAAILTEIYMLHTLMFAGSFESRSGEVVHKINQGLIINPYNRLKVTIGNIGSRIRRSRENNLRRINENNVTTTSQKPQAVPEPEATNQGIPAENETINLGNNGKQEAGAFQNFEEDNVAPEDCPVRVIGGGEVMTPREARKFPEFYVIEEERDEETGELSYRIYTREFHEQLQTQNV